MDQAMTVNPQSLFRAPGEAGERVEARIGPLSEEHISQLAWAKRGRKGVNKAIKFASMSGWTTLVFGVLALPFALGGGAALPLSIALIGVGYHELALRKRLRQLDRSACTTMALNQCVLACVIIAYAIWMLYTGMTGEGMLTSALADNSQIAGEEMIEGIMSQMESLEKLALLGIYGGLIVGTVLFQGYGAVYYLLKKRAVGKYLAQTPGWIIELSKRDLLG